MVEWESFVQAQNCMQILGEMPQLVSHDHTPRVHAAKSLMCIALVEIMVLGCKELLENYNPWDAAY